LKLWQGLREFIVGVRRASAMVEHEAANLIELEGPLAHSRALEQAQYCREVGSESGYRYWSRIAVLIAKNSGVGRRKLPV
jgi:hypothetical protein